ncbi:MAG: MASE3 domain-containing protein [Candidatus Methanoperedens sp.]|nr:MASE3 domain-containing protein [Candidatus Methanoperedens sp.]
MGKTNHFLELLTIIVSVFLIGYFLESFKLGPASLRDFFHISTELLPLVLSFSIFVMTWFVYHRSRDNHSLFMGWAFFVIGLLDLYQMLSYPFMPDFITVNSFHKSEIFWSEARLISSVLFFVSVYVYKDTSLWLTNKFKLLTSVFVVSFICLAIGFFPAYIPSLTFPDGSPTREKMLLLIITSLIFFYTSYLYTRRLQETGQKNLMCLIYGFILLAFSGLIDLFYHYPGNLLKAAGFYFLYLGLFKLSIETPYEKLAEVNEKRIHEARERYRSLFDNAYDAIVTTDIEGSITSWNRSAEKIFGWTAAEIIGKKLPLLIFDQNLLAEKDQIMRNAISGETVTGIETALMRKDGTKIDVSMTISPLRDSNQNAIGMSGIMRDITERRRAEEQIKTSLKEKEVLLREIHHRVKNNMQIISSLLKLQSSYIKDKKYGDIYKESQNRIIAMSLIHEKLYQSRDFTKIDSRGYIKDLVNGLVQSYEVPGRIKFIVNVEIASLSMNTAVPCGLLINELVSNSVKHGFPDGRDGEIKISLHPIEDNKIELIVSDNGIGIPENIDFRKTNSWGLRLITILSENQLHGDINLDRSKGTEFRIIFRDVK